jgi:hypothetical protein
VSVGVIGASLWMTRAERLRRKQAAAALKG